MVSPYIFLDRDGTLNIEKDYLHDPDELELCFGVSQGLEKLASAGYRFIVVTNQSGIGRGYYTVEDMHAVHRRMSELLAFSGIIIDAYFFCPHAPSEQCNCRKPQLGMFEQAMQSFDIDLTRSWMVGDKDVDISFGKKAGLSTALVLTGYGKEYNFAKSPKPDKVVATLEELMI